MGKFYYCILLTLLVRGITVFILDQIPCMEPGYLAIGMSALDGNKCEVSLAPFYSIMVATLFKVTNSLMLASSFLYILFSLSISYFSYRIVKLFFDERAAIYVLLLLVFMPNLAIAVAGYSHNVVAAAGMLMGAIFYLSLYFKEKTLKSVYWFVFYSIIAVIIRPENLVILFMCTAFAFLFLVYQGNKVEGVILACFFSGAFSLTLLVHNWAVGFLSSTNQYLSVFCDRRYSYFTFIHTYSIRYGQAINNEMAAKFSEPFIGSPISNEYLISKAILGNLKQFMSNSLFMSKELLDMFGHPLFIPIYFYFFIGIVVVNVRKEVEQVFGLGVLSVVCLGQIIWVLIFHCEVRYLLPISIVLTLFVGIGLKMLPANWQIGVFTIIMVLTFIIYLMYFVNNIGLDSLCG